MPILTKKRFFSTIQTIQQFMTMLTKINEAIIRFTVISFLFFFSGSAVSGQADTLHVDLSQVIALAIDRAPDVQIAKTALSNNFWRYQSFLADYRPQIDLTATFPNFNRSIEPITLPDGTDKFVNRSLMSNSVGLSLQQGITLTGGRIFANTGLQRIDIFSTTGGDNTFSYLSTPINIGFIQPIFGFNDLKWDKRIQPVVYDEAKRGYSEDMEEVAFQAAQFFFQVLNAQLNLEAALRDKANADTLYVISKGRYEVGRIAETELMQIELRVMNADADIARSYLNLQTNTERLRNFLGITEAVDFQLTPPYEMPAFNIDTEQALGYALRYRSEKITFQRRLLEAERSVAQAKANSGPNIDLSINFGLSQTGGSLSNAYAEPLDNERVRLGLTMPIADWGKSKARLEISKSQQSLTQLQVSQEQVNFEREIIIKVQQFDLLRTQVRLSLRTYEVAEKRLDISRKRYRIGKIGVTDLNIAISEESTARRGYIASLQEFWLAYFELRRLTLFDFERNQPLIREN